MTRIFRWAALFLAVAACRLGWATTFGDERLSVSIDDCSGAMTFCADGVVRLIPDPKSPRTMAMGKGSPGGLDACVEPERFLRADMSSDGTVRVDFAEGSWLVSVFLELHPAKRMVRRWVVFETQSAKKTKFNGITLSAGKVCGANALAGYFFPCEFPPRRHAQSDFSPGAHRMANEFVGATIGDDGAGHNVIHVVNAMRSYSDKSNTHVTERVDGFRMASVFSSRGYALPGVPQIVGDEWLVFGAGDVEDGLLAMHDWYRTAGLVPPVDRPEERMRRQIVYSNHPVGKSEFGACDEGGFNGAQNYLPFVEALGVKTIWMRPVTWPGQYNPIDLYRLMDGVGTEEDFRDYVRAAHARRLEVWSDAVPHGGRVSQGERSKAHPEFVCKREDGRDQDDYWAYDFNWPTWVAYFGDWVEWATRRFELDGWRMDVPAGSRFANWNPDIPYARASYAQRQGGIAQQRSIRASARRANPNAVTMGEENDSCWSCVTDAIYDQLLCHAHFHDFRERDAASVVRDLRRWLHEQRYSYMPGTIWMRYPESHDSMMAANLWGRPCATALMALCAWIDGFPLVYEQGEEGVFETYRRIFAIRDAVPELTMGESDYLSYPAAPGVFACVRSLPESQSVVLVNFNDFPSEGLPPFGYAVRRLKGRPVEELLKDPRPYLPAKKGPVPRVAEMGGVGLCGGAVAELRDMTNGCVRAPYVLTVSPMSDGSQRLAVGDWAGLDPAKVRLVVRFAGTERWFAHAAEGSFESPYYVWHPEVDVVYPEACGKQSVERAVRWSNLAHPFGFEREHAAVGAVAGSSAVQIDGFAEGVRVDLRDRLGNEHGFSMTLESPTAEGFACRLSEISADAACANRGVGTGDARLRVSAGGWTYEEPRLKVRLSNSGAIVGVWTKDANGLWQAELGLCGWRGTKTSEAQPRLSWRLRDEQTSEQFYECYAKTVITHGTNDSVRMSFREVRPKMFGKRYLTYDIVENVDYVFGEVPGQFRVSTGFRLAKGSLGKNNGLWEYRLRRSRSAAGSVENVRVSGRPPARRDDDGLSLRFIYHDARTSNFSSPPGSTNQIEWIFRSDGASSGQAFLAASGLRYVDPMIGTEGIGTEYGGMMPMAGSPFGSMNLVPVTRTNGVSRTSFNALDRQLLGFILTRQPAIWMGDWGPVRIWLPKPLPLEGIEAAPHLVKVRAGGRLYELAASAHVAFIRSDDPFLAEALPVRGSTTERTQRTSTQPIPNFRCHYATEYNERTLKVAVSLVSADEAEKSLRLEGAPGLDGVAATVRRDWEALFSRVTIDAPDDVKTIFYTALYHSMLYPRRIDERGRYYSAMDDTVHEGEMYTCFSLWDTYRAEHPLLTLVAPERVDGMMQSLVNMYREGGWLPLWPNPGYTGQMIGGPAEVALAEAYVKGFRGFDAEGAWEAVLKNATVPQAGDLERRWPGTLDDPPGPPETRSGLTRYMANGYVAADETNESVSRTLDYAFDDAAVASFAAALGKSGIAAEFRARSKNYSNLWNAAAARFLPRNADGKWVDPATLDRKRRAYTETDPQTARWCVPHDVEGLVALMGGREQFVRELDHFFDEEFYRKDAVGCKSVHGNETAHHAAYLYNRVGEYDKTCRRVRDILRKCYSPDRRGFDGNEDCGQMSAWYIFSALGFYPLDPASGWYEIGSPLVKGATLRFGAPYASATLEIRVKNHAPDCWRVKRVTLNGVDLKERRVRHADLVKGGVLEFEL